MLVSWLVNALAGRLGRGSNGDRRGIGGLLEVCWRMLEDAGGCWKSLQLEQVVCLLSCQRRKPGISVFLELVIH